MKKKIILSIVLAVVSIGLAVLGYIILPEQVVVQFSIGSSGVSTAPKLLALLLPTILGIAGAAIYLFSNSNEKTARKSLIVSIVGIVLGIIMIAVNSFM